MIRIALCAEIPICVAKWSTFTVYKYNLLKYAQIALSLQTGSPTMSSMHKDKLHLANENVSCNAKHKRN